MAASSTRARNGRIWTGISGWKAGRELWRACNCVIERNPVIYLLEKTYSCRVVVHDDESCKQERLTASALLFVIAVIVQNLLETGVQLTHMYDYSDIMSSGTREWTTLCKSAWL